MTSVGIAGPGRAGTLVAMACVRAGWRVTAVAGGSAASRDRFTGKVAGVRQVAVEELAAAADLIVLAVPDRAVAEVADALASSTGLGERHRIVHLAGVLDCRPLRRAGLAGARIAACHPAMTLPADADPDALIGAAWAVTVPPGADDRWAVELVATLGGQPFTIPERDRVRYHAALTVGANAVGAAVATARQLLVSTGIDEPRSILEPLVAASVDHVLRDGAKALTGPVMRGDAATVAAHLADLDRDLPPLAAAYRGFAAALIGHARLVLSQSQVADLEAALARRGPGDGP